MMNEKSFPVGSIIQGGGSIYLKDKDMKWLAFDPVVALTADEVQEFFDRKSQYAVKFEVLYKPGPAEILEELPSGSVIIGGGSVVAIKFGKDWLISGSRSGYGSAAVLEILGNEFEVLRRGETD